MKYVIELEREFEDSSQNVMVGRILKKTVTEYSGEETDEYVLTTTNADLTLTEIEEAQAIINHLSLYGSLSEGWEEQR